MNTGRHGDVTTIILGSADLERAVDKYNTIEGHGSCGILCASELGGKLIGEEQALKLQLYLDESIVLLVITLDSENGVAWATSTNVHFVHLGIKEVGKVLLIDLRSDTANIQAARLARKVGVRADTHAKGGYRHRRRKACDAKDGRWLRAVSTGKVEETYSHEIRT